MTRKATPEECRRICPVCEEPFYALKPSTKQRCCSHACAFTEIGDKVRAAASTPEARAKSGDALRDRGEGKSYRKRGGRHEHRVVMEEKLGRALLPGEIVHHRDETKRNNAPDNLELTNRRDHARHHNLGKKRPPKTVCKFGHPLTDDNIRITSKGHRRCLTCARSYDRQWQQERRDAHH